MANVNIQHFNYVTPSGATYGTISKAIVDTIVANVSGLTLKEVVTDTSLVYVAEYYVSSDHNSWLRLGNSGSNSYYFICTAYRKQTSTTQTNMIGTTIGTMSTVVASAFSFYIITVGEFTAILHSLADNSGTSAGGFAWSYFTDISTNVKYSIYSGYSPFSGEGSSGLFNLTWRFCWVADGVYDSGVLQYLNVGATPIPSGKPFMSPIQLYYRDFFGKLGDMNDWYRMDFRPTTASFYVNLPCTLEFTLDGQQFVCIAQDLYVKKDTT